MDPAELVSFFSDRQAAHVYALADLEAPFWEPSSWYRRDDAVVGLVRLPDTDATTVYAVSTRDPESSLGLVVDLLPFIKPGTLLTGPVGLADAVRPHREVLWDDKYLRYALVDREAALSHETPTVEPIDSDRVDDLVALYASDPGAAFFLPHMISYGAHVGVYDQGRLVAAAGAHVLSAVHRCAAIGSVYTRPSHRGRGLGRAVTAGVIARIADRVDTIGLNVAADNLAARAVYDGLGFEPILTYAEAEVSGEQLPE